jgi:phospholipid transport system substrate-binding protein
MRFRRFWIVLLAVAGAIAGTVPSRAGEDGWLSDASTLIRSLDDQAIGIVRAKNLDDADRERSFRAMFVTSFDVPAIGRFVLGRYWHTASDAQKSEFLGLFEDMIVTTYSRRFTGHRGEPVAILGVRADGGSAVVASAFAQQNRPATKVDWRVIKADSQLKIVDVVIEGVSMSLTQQQEFGAVIQRNGGRVDGLLTTMRERAQLQNRTARQ